MEQITTCPFCKYKYDIQPDICHKCGYPFLGSEKEKSVFIGQQILKKGKVTDTRSKIKRARIIIWSVGGLNMLYPLSINPKDPMFLLYLISGFLVGSVFIGFGFLSYKKPFISILIPLIILTFSYISQIINDSNNIVEGIIWKLIIFGSLIYALIEIVKAEKIRKESEFLNEHNFK